MGKDAEAALAKIQEQNFALGTPSNGKIMTTQTLTLLLNKLPIAARRAFRVPDIPHNLIAAAELIDAGCSIHLHRHGFEINYEGEVLYKGWRDIPTRLWRMDISRDDSNKITPDTDPSEYDGSKGMVMAAEATIHWCINAIYQCENTEQLIKYYHASLSSHPKATLAFAEQQDYLKGFPCLSARLINKYIGVELATEAGHMRAFPKGVRSTSKPSNRGRPRNHAPTKEELTNAVVEATSIPQQTSGNKRTHWVFMTAALADGWMASDQTGAFPRTSNRGHKYMAVFYVFDANFIKGVPIKSRNKEELLRAYKIIYDWCEQRGVKPKLHRMDNETSQEVESFIKGQQQTQLQYTAPDRHCPPAEKAVQTYKCAFKSTLASLPTNFPLALWCRLLPQIDLSVNIVRPNRLNPKLSAWAAMEGDFHFDKTPIAPPGSEMVIHEKPSRRSTFGSNAKKAWYLGPCLDHYRTFKGLLPSTGGERMSDTVKFRHHAIAIPELTPADRILEAAKQLDEALRQQPASAPMDTLTAIELLREVLVGEKRKPLPDNNVQKTRAAQKRAEKLYLQAQPADQPQRVDVSTPQRVERAAAQRVEQSPEEEPNYISDDEEPHPSPSAETKPNDINDAAGYASEEEDEAPPHKPRRSPRLHRIAALATTETAHVPRLAIQQKKYTQGYAAANLELQLKEWAFDQHNEWATKYNFAGAVVDKETGKLLEYRDLVSRPELRETWIRSLANELGRLAQGVRDIKGTNTIFFITKSEIPKDKLKQVTYARIVCDYKPNKLEKNRTRVTVGGDRIVCDYDISSPTCDMPTIKLLWNSVLSTPGAKYFTMDISNFYLGSPLDKPEFMRMPYKLMPEEIIQKYQLKSKEHDGWVYIKIVKGMYGLPQAGKIANDLLKKRLEYYGYYPTSFTPGLWKHVWRPVQFTLVVDDFGIKFTGLQHANHLRKTLEKHYDVTCDWEGSKYVGIDLKWDYQARTLDTSVPGYVPAKLDQHKHPTPPKPQHAPSKAPTKHYGQKVQKATPIDTSKKLSPQGIKRIQEIVGSFAWYSRATDPTMAKTLSSIAGRQAEATENLEEEVRHFMDYCATHPDAVVRFMASDMILALHSDASYLSEPGAKSRAGGHFYLKNKTDRDTNNGAVLTLSKIIKHVMTSASEAEIAALFLNCKAAIPLRMALEEMGHPQPQTPAVTDNSSAEGLINKSMTPKRAKAHDVRFNWLKCREAQKQFDLVWRPGKINKADYHTKDHPPSHHKERRGDYVAAPAA